MGKLLYTKLDANKIELVNQGPWVYALRKGLRLKFETYLSNLFPQIARNQLFLSINHKFLLYSRLKTGTLLIDAFF